jgi:heptosyltransferase-2
MPSREVRKILVRGTNWLGDAVMTIPALQRLRASFPRAHITLLAPPRAAEVLRGVTALDEIILYLRKEEGVQAFRAARHELQRAQFDMALLFQNAFEAALLAWLGGVPLRIGYATQGRGVLLTHKLTRGKEHRNRHQTHDYLDLVAEAERVCLGQESTAARDNIPSLQVSDAQTKAAANFARRWDLDPGTQTLIALNVGATNSRAKCWGEDRFAALADRLATRPNAHILLIGAVSENEQAARVQAQMQPPHQARNLAGETTMPELIGVLASCSLLVTNDTGPAHVAAALGIPTLTLFGPTNEFETAPLGLRSELLRADGIECARCMHRTCPIDHRCMTRLTVDTVAAKAVSLLENV